MPETILIVYCTHGDEIITEQVALKAQEKHGVEIYMGNPAAHKECVRFLESDLNRSFARTDTLEGKRAQEIKSDFDNHPYDLILDLHTTKTKAEPFAIITDLSQLKYAAYTGFRRVVYMSREFSTGGSFIESISRSVSIEVYDDQLGKTALASAIDYVYSDKQNNTFEVYKVEEVVPGENRFDVTNFKKQKNGMYPVFAGDNTYKNVSYLNSSRYDITLA